MEIEEFLGLEDEGEKDGDKIVISIELHRHFVTALVPGKNLATKLHFINHLCNKRNI